MNVNAPRNTSSLYLAIVGRFRKPSDVGLMRATTSFGGPRAAERLGRERDTTDRAGSLPGDKVPRHNRSFQTNRVPARGAHPCRLARRVNQIRAQLCVDGIGVRSHICRERFDAVPDDFASAMTEPVACSWFDGQSEPRKA
ncbi:MAG: hypothetical protein NT069_00965, partial [Planctomycetota bacterium]|nr:hypothetical protein [Planctomycetota bacterium]